jgi:predicted enzyme related to lactoylglutathione lyase
MADNFVWYELCTSDVDAAQHFYRQVIGWEAAPFPQGAGADYRVLSAAGRGVAGLMPLPDGMARPFWLGYVGVADCDAAIASATAVGATFERVIDSPEVGKIALISDPQGIGYAMIETYGDHRSDAFNQALPGHGNWHELCAVDATGAFEFYAAQYGWTKGLTMPMGSMGSYQLVQADGVDIGAIVSAGDGMIPGWLFYFGVPDIDAAAASITGNGGTIRYGPAEVPGGVWIVQFADPQGATAAIVGPRK